MKNALILAASVIVILVIIVAIIKFENGNLKNIEDYEYTFKAQVIEKYENSIIVKPYEDENISSSGDKVSVELTNVDLDIQIDDKVLIAYTGEVMESYPLQINMIDIKILNEGDEVK